MATTNRDRLQTHRRREYVRKERAREIAYQAALRGASPQGRSTGASFSTRSLVAGLGLAASPPWPRWGSARPSPQDRPLTPTFYQWIEDLHPGIPAVNAKFPGINYQIAPVEGFGIERFVAEAKNKQSTWDVYVGQTPFVEMSAMIKADVIEPWDNYIPKDVLDDIIPSIREECTIDGKLYGWPFLLDVIGTGWHSGLTTQGRPARRGARDLGRLPGRAKKVVDSEAAPWGATFDAHGWRSLAPITHSMSTNVYTPEGLFDFTSEPAIEALKLMKQIMAVANPDILLEGALRRRRQRNPGRGRLRRPARRPTTSNTSTRRCAWRRAGTIRSCCTSGRCRNSPTAKARRCSGRPAARCSSTARTRRRRPNTSRR